MKDIEIEIKFKVTKKLFVKIQNKIKPVSECKGKTQEVDTYFNPPHKNFFKSKHPDEYLRLRETANEATFTYKHPYFNHNGERTHSDEFETNISDPKQLFKILEILGFKRYIAIDKIRVKYDYRRFEIAFDQVKNLGCFIEIESHVKSKNVDQAHQKILDLAVKLGIDPKSQDTSGYVLLRLKKVAS